MLNPLNTIVRDPGSLLYVSGWRAVGWIAHHIWASQPSVLWIRLDGCRTLADCTLVLGHALELALPGSSAAVATALSDRSLHHLVVDARTVDPELVGAFHSMVSGLSHKTLWWVAIHEPESLANHVATNDPVPAIDEDLPAPIEAGVWFPNSPRVRLSLPTQLSAPDAPNGCLRPDVIAQLRKHPRRSLNAVVDGLILNHQDLFPAATEMTLGPLEPTELFGLRLIAEYATDDNVACLAAASAARIRLRYGQGTEALNRIDQALARTTRADPAHRALIVWAEAVVQLHLGDISRAEARFAEATALVQVSRDLSLLATIHRRWGDALTSRSLLTRASKQYRVARGLYRQRGDGEGISAALRGTADIAVAAGELFSAEALYDQAEMNTTTDEEQFNRQLGGIGLAISQRNWTRANKMLRRARNIGDPSSLTQASLNRREADAALRSGDAVSAQPTALASGKLFTDAGRPIASAASLRLQADAMAMQGELRHAFTLYSATIQAQSRAGDWTGLERTITRLVVLERSAGEESQAVELESIVQELSLFRGHP
jgi:tetratricopeptide (TPR) repeat protein